MNGTIEIKKVPAISHFTLLSWLSTYFENGNWTRDFVTRNIVLETPTAKIVPPIRLSFMKIAKMGSIRPKPVTRNMSESINSFIVRFIN